MSSIIIPAVILAEPLTSVYGLYRTSAVCCSKDPEEIANGPRGVAIFGLGLLSYAATTVALNILLPGSGVITNHLISCATSFAAKYIPSKLIDPSVRIYEHDPRNYLHAEHGQLAQRAPLPQPQPVAPPAQHRAIDVQPPRPFYADQLPPETVRTQGRLATLETQVRTLDARVRALEAPATQPAYRAPILPQLPPAAAQDPRRSRRFAAIDGHQT